MFRIAERRWRRPISPLPPPPPPLTLQRRRGSRSSKRIRVKRRAFARRLTVFASLLFSVGVLVFVLRKRHPFESLLNNTALKTTTYHANNSNTETKSTSANTKVVYNTTTTLPSHVHHALKQTQHYGVLPPQRSFTVRCFKSRSSGASVCAHRPICASAGGLISLSRAKNAATERYTEENGDIPVLLRQDARYLNTRQIHWWEGGHIIINAGPKSASIVQFARRIIIAHHVMTHRENYGIPRLHSIIIIASPSVLRRLRYSRSWHRALLDTLSYPQRPDLRRRAALRFARRSVPPPYPRVLVLPSWKSLAPNTNPKTIACFRNIAFASPPSQGFILQSNEFPRSTNEKSSDIPKLRESVFHSILARRAPPARKRLVYVHRSRIRSFSPQSTARLERTLQDISRSFSFEYIRLDADGLPVSSILAALGDAGIVVGVHGTTLLATLFLAPGSAVVEILPYRFINDLYSRSIDSEVSYSSHNLVNGDDYPALVDFGNVQECQVMSPRCRSWYRSDSRELRFGSADARAISKLISAATSYVTSSLKE